jgi:ATP-dependent DNA helicase RecQ
VCLVDESNAAIQDRREILLREFEAPRKSKKAAVAGLSGVRLELFEAMREKRKAIAAEREVPAYVIFHDATLIEIARALPSSIEELKAVPGVGDRRATDLGPAFLPLMKEFRSRISQEGPRLSADTSEKLRPHFEAGKSVPDAAAKAGLAVSTVQAYLVEWVQDTQPRTLSPWVEAETEARIREAIKESGSGRLRPVFEALNEEVSYDQIRLVMTSIKSGHAVV